MHHQSFRPPWLLPLLRLPRLQFIFQLKSLVGFKLPKFSMNISPHEAIKLPIHDAHLLTLTFPPGGDSFGTISVKLRINPNECFDPFRRLGIAVPDLWLIFQNCWQVNASLIGYCSGTEVISAFEIIEPSDLKQKLHSFGTGNSKMVHFRIQGSHGTKLDIIASEIVIEPDMGTNSPRGAKEN